MCCVLCVLFLKGLRKGLRPRETSHGRRHTGRAVAAIGHSPTAMAIGMVPNG